MDPNAVHAGVRRARRQPQVVAEEAKAPHVRWSDDGRGRRRGTGRGEEDAVARAGRPRPRCPSFTAERMLLSAEGSPERRRRVHRHAREVTCANERDHSRRRGGRDARGAGSRRVAAEREAAAIDRAGQRALCDGVPREGERLVHARWRDGEGERADDCSCREASPLEEDRRRRARERACAISHEHDDELGTQPRAARSSTASG